jgi:lipoprotein-anchoring transpeptidase ErfK/SrfK
MSGVIIREGLRSLLGAAAVATMTLVVAAPAIAGDKVPKPPDPTPAPPGPPAPQPPPLPPADATTLKLKLKGEKRGQVPVGQRVRIVGTMHPWRPNQQVTVTVTRGKRKVKKEVAEVTHAKGNVGRFKVKSPRLVEPGRYQATVQHAGNAMLKGATVRSRKFKPRYPSLHRGEGGREVKLFNRLLDKQGYVPSNGKRYTERTARAVIAYRKVNGMARITRATSGIFKKLAGGRGTYNVKHPGAGKHAEVNLGRQVLVLAEGGKARRIYHVSTGAGGTPSDRGLFRFNRRQPGYNALRMYYTTYYNGGEGIHGYHSVPVHPASHGCIRTPISDARNIYGWVQLGMSIYVY